MWDVSNLALDCNEHFSVSTHCLLCALVPYVLRTIKSIADIGVLPALCKGPVRAEQVSVA